jgi:cysteine desulfurase/selenocysteine lyase
MPSRLYVDNAATSFPKPPEVLEAIQAYAEDLGASAGRGAYQEAIETGDILASCRGRLARLIHAEAPEQVVFTMNCSVALNQAIKGHLRRGDHVVTTTMEHNSVLRPLHALSAAGRIQADYVQADASTGLVEVDALFAAVRPQTRLIAVTHASNVCGSLQAIEAIGRESRRRGTALLVDAAQTIGHVPIDVQAVGIDLLAVPGHKGLMGPLGTGALYIRPGLDETLQPLMEGGTGSVSDRAAQPEFMPDKFEPGSHNAIGLAGLDAAIAWIEDRTVDALRARDLALSSRFLERTADIASLTVFGPGAAADRIAVFSVCVAGMSPDRLSASLEDDFGILTRSGIHCAPMAHATLGTDRSGGTTRLSFGAYNSLDDVDRCATALAELAGVKGRARSSLAAPVAGE